MALQVGEIVGNYRIERLLGAGGMGEVYLAVHPGIGRRAAVKVLHPHLAKDQAVVLRFFNEARAANAIRHPGIVEVFDFGTLPSGASYIIMEFLEGESLTDRIARNGRLRIGEAVEVTAQAANGLAAAHAKGIVHRDLKPDNIFLVPDSQIPGREVVKILDFGIAKLGAALGAASSLTRTGSVMGTPVYMSPEQCKGAKEVDHRSDIYSLGIILYQMLTGAPPFSAEGYGELIYMHIAVAPAPPRKVNAGIPEDLADVVMAMLAKEPGERLQTMAAVQQALRDARSPTAVALGAAEEDAGGPAAPLVRRSPTPDPPLTTLSASASYLDDDMVAAVSRPRWVLPAAFVGIGSVALAAILMLRNETPEQTPVAVAAPAAISANAAVPASLAPLEVPVAKTVLPPAGKRAKAPAEEPGHAPAAGPARIAIKIATNPPGAKVLRVSDGALLGVTPFSTRWKNTPGTEKMVLEKDGYRSLPLAVPHDEEVELTLDLVPDGPPAKARRESRVVAAARKPARNPIAAPAVPLTSPPPSPPAKKIPFEI